MKITREDFIQDTRKLAKDEETSVNEIANLVYEFACENSDQLDVDFDGEGSGEYCKQSEAPQFYDSIGDSWGEHYRDSAMAMQSILDEIYEDLEC